MRMTAQQVAEHQARVAAGKGVSVQESRPASSDREWPLHAKIIEHCEKQNPRWRYRHMRYNVASTEDIAGVEDFTLFLPNGRTVHIECKKSDGKLDKDQVIWKFELERLGHVVHVIRSFEEFLGLTIRDN